MNLIEIFDPGQCTTVQDLGRPGFGAFGISRSGTADREALRVGNRIVGNPDPCAGIEMMFVGASLRFRCETSIALTGGTVNAQLNGRSLPMWRAVSVRAGDHLQIGRIRNGVYTLLCVGGGIAIEEVFSSRSTHLATQFGGKDGRALQSGDVLTLGDASRSDASRSLADRRAVRESIAALTRYLQRRAIRVVEGPHAGLIASGTPLLEGRVYSVSTEMNRVGTRLVGPIMDGAKDGDMRTEAAWHGAIQLLPTGLPIVLGPETAPTGGYPIIASVIAADLASFAQKRPGDDIRFLYVTHEAARRAYCEARSKVDAVLPPIGVAEGLQR